MVNPQMEGTERTRRPMVTGSTVLGLKYKDGIMLAADTLCSYGNMARYKNTQRIAEVAPFTLVAAAGEYSDFQYIQKMCKDIETEDWAHMDGHRLGAQEFASYLGRVMYGRRSRINPLWNQLIVGGYQKGEKVLKYIDLQGTSYSENYLATGFGIHLALPIIRKEWREDMTEDEARTLLETCLRVLFYRDCVAYDKIRIATSTAAGTRISEPYKLEGKWDHSMWVRTGADVLTGTTDTW